MMNMWRRMLMAASIMSLLGSACSALGGAPSPRVNDSPNGKSWRPASTATPSELANGALIPITGENVLFLQCQFCVGEETHAVLLFPDTAYFTVDSSSPDTCLTADVVNGRRIVICRGPQSSSFNLSVCSDPSNCLQFPVVLQPCALLEGSVTTFVPGYLAPIDKRKSDDGNDPTQPANTPVSAPPVINPTDPTKEPKPTNEPKPTKEPKPSKPTKMPKPTKNKD